MYIYIYIYTYICVYTQYNLPPLNNDPPNKQKPLGEQLLFTINLDGGTITPLINDDFGFDLSPHNYPPLTKNLGGTIICYQFRRRHDYPLYNKRCSVKPPPSTKKWRFCC